MKRIAIRRGSVIALVAAVIGVALLSSGPSIAAPSAVVASMKTPAGQKLGTVIFSTTEDGKVMVQAIAKGLTPGFHGFHVHGAGICDGAATDAAGNPSPFLTAGGHYNPTAQIHGSHAGDMPPLYVAGDGTAQLRFVTDRFTVESLLDADGSAVIMHAGPDNLAHIPATTATGGERYHSHVDLVFGPDTATRGTGDAGSRFSCGVVSSAP
ncbi:MAG: superoxide dismutase family protein [Actinomycetota bacterium]